VSVDNLIYTRERPAIRSVTMWNRLGIAALAAMLLVAACGGDDDDGSGPPAPSEPSVTYDEGTIRMDIENLDTGLLKGHSYVDATEGWAVEGVMVTAVADDGARWGVIEIPEDGDSDYTTFFEVQVQELPRGDQVTLTTTASFSSGSGPAVERTAVDKWPP